MKSEFTNAVVSAAPAKIATNGSALCTFDTKGYDSLKIMVQQGTAASTSAFFTTLKVTESDTVTNASSQTAIVALTGGTATSTAVGFVWADGTNANTGGQIYEFQIDLRKRKRYIGVTATPAQAAGDIIGIIGELYRAETSADTTTSKFESNLESTASTSVIKIIQAL